MSRANRNNSPGDPAGGDDGEASAKGSFKLTLLETAAADPQLDPCDIRLLIAYCTLLQWPKRFAWLAGSAARARANLSDRQIRYSRARLEKRGYLVKVGRQGTSTLYRVENPHAEAMRMHVQEATDYFREQTRDRQSARRAMSKAVPAKIAATETAMSQSPCERDNPANIAGNYPSYTPQNRALERNTDLSVCLQFGLDDPLPVPSSDSEATKVLHVLLRGVEPEPAVMGYFRHALASGNLTRHDVERYRRVA